MGKASRTKRLSAREKIAIEREAARRAQRRNQLFITGGSIVAVVAIVAVMIVLKTAGSSSPGSSNSGGRAALPAGVAQQITSVPAATLDSVGAGSVSPSTASSVFVPGSGTVLTSQGKPEMMYIGAEFCPLCAATRWSMAVALSRFGTLSTPFQGIHSSSTDTDPNTPTLTFYKTTYSSKYLTFTPVENEKVDKSPLQATTAEQNQIWAKYEPDPSQRGYPFIDFGNKYVLKGTLYDPKVLAGKSWSQVAAALHDPSSPIAKGALGAANFITAAICKMTNDQPTSVCASKAVTSVQGRL